MRTPPEPALSGVEGAVRSSEARQAFANATLIALLGKSFDRFSHSRGPAQLTVKASHPDVPLRKAPPSSFSAPTRPQPCTNSCHPPVDAPHSAENTPVKIANFSLTLKTKSVKTYSFFDSF